MPLSGQMADQPEQKSTNINTAPEEQTLTPRQQRKQDALELAELIYDIFEANESSANIGANAISGKDKQND